MFASFLSSFPEFTQMDDTLSKLVSAGERDASCRAEVYQAPPFRLFAAAQAPPLNSVLSSLQQQLQDHATAKRQTVLLGSNLRREIQPLKLLNTDFKDRKKKHTNLESVYDKSVKSAASAKEKADLQFARNPSSPDSRKLNTEAEVLARKRDNTESEVKKSAADLKQSEKIYKKELFVTLLKGIEKFATGRKQQINSELTCAREIGNLAETFEPYEDPGIEKLRAELAQIRETED
jgi:hypothetical protein